MRANRIGRFISLRALAWSLGILTFATLINLFGIHLLGGIEQWQQWLYDSYWYFLAWRVCLYSAAIWGWRWARPRIIARESIPPHRLRRAELCLAAAVLLMELTRALPHIR